MPTVPAMGPAACQALIGGAMNVVRRVSLRGRCYPWSGPFDDPGAGAGTAEEEPVDKGAGGLTYVVENTTACGDGTVDHGEECDDGNRTNGDGCNRRCDLEPRTSLPACSDTEPSAPGSLTPGDPFIDCYDERQIVQFSAGAPLSLRLCTVTCVDPQGAGAPLGMIEREVANAQVFFDMSQVGIVLSLRHSVQMYASDESTDPKTQAELDALHAFTRQTVDQRFPGECEVGLGFANTLRHEGGALGGQAISPKARIETAFVPTSAIGGGNITAHELGHVLGLMHTFEEDHCSDTPEDSN